MNPGVPRHPSKTPPARQTPAARRRSKHGLDYCIGFLAVIIHPQISGYAQALVGPGLPALRDKLAAWNTDLSQYQAWLRSFHLISVTFRGRAGAMIAVAGFVVFLVGDFSAAAAFSLAGELALGGMAAVFAGGLLRVYSE